jgi:hypothetical protein
MPHVMPKWYRDNPGLVDEKTKQNRDEHADRERREFIREHAIRIDAAVCAASATGARRDQEGSILPAKRVWELARELWDARPEDC